MCACEENEGMPTNSSKATTSGGLDRDEISRNILPVYLKTSINDEK